MSRARAGFRTTLSCLALLAAPLDAAADDGPALAAACAAAAQAGTPLSIARPYRISAPLHLACGLAFTAQGQLVPERGARVTIDGAIDAAPTARLFGSAARVIARSAPWVSVAWWGALEAAASGADAMPAIRASFGPNRTIHFPPATYTCRSLLPSPYPPEYGVGGTVCADLHGHSRVTLEGYGATLARDDAHKDSIWLVIRHAEDVHVRGFSFAASAWTAPSSMPSGIALHVVSNFEVADLRFTGNWGGSTRQPVALAGEALTNGLFQRLEMPAQGICFDLAFLRKVTIRDVRAVGADDAGSTRLASRTPCINIENNHEFVKDWPKEFAFHDTSDVTLGPNLDISNFVAAIFLRAGSRYTITGNHLHDNPGSATPAAVSAGAGIYLYYEPHPTVRSSPDEVRDVTITGNTIRRNGATVPGGGILIDASKGTTAGTTAGAISNVTISGNVFEGNAREDVSTLEPRFVRGIAVRGNTFGRAQPAAR